MGSTIAPERGVLVLCPRVASDAWHVPNRVGEMVIPGCPRQRRPSGEVGHVGPRSRCRGDLASNSREHLHGSLLSLTGEVVNTHGPVEPDKDNIRQEPYTLPQGFTWDALDLGDRGVVSTGSSAHTC